MQINLTQEEISDILKYTHNNMVLDCLDDMIKYFRHKQKDYIEGDGSVSGVDGIIELLTNGYMSMSMFLQILPAIENYNSPYKINQTT